VNLKVGAKECQQNVGAGANKNAAGDLVQDALQAGPQVTPYDGKDHGHHTHDLNWTPLLALWFIMLFPFQAHC